MPRTVHYFGWPDLVGLIPEDFAIQALDDDEDGQPEMWETARDAAADAVDAYLEGRYPVPLTGSIPALVKRAAVLFCASDCFNRRKQSDLFPHKRELASRQKSLEDIRTGATQLTPGRASKKPRGAVIQTPSRVHANGRIGS
jgi:phage gp36-like protein